MEEEDKGREALASTSGEPRDGKEGRKEGGPRWALGAITS